MTGGAKGADSPECWVSLGAVAALTSKIKFGPLVTPVGFGGRTPRVVGAAAQNADEWNIFSPTLELYGKLRKVFDSTLGEREVQVSQMGTFLIGENNRELKENASHLGSFLGIEGGAEATIERVKQRGGFCGTTEEFVSQVNERLEVGIEKFYFQLLDTRNKQMVDLLTETLKREF